MAKSGRQKAAELKVRKKARVRKRSQRALEDRQRFKAEMGVPADGVRCNPSLLEPSGSYSDPTFVQRGYYLDEAFQCSHKSIGSVRLKFR